MRRKNVAQWTFWFRTCAGTFATQPYQALAAAYESAGYDNLARLVMSGRAMPCAPAPGRTGRSPGFAGPASSSRSG